jgi:two-component system cell cycle sensor histidine kinase/response regulator CckA
MGAGQVGALGEFERLPVAGLVLELDGTIVAINAAAIRLFGATGAGVPVWDLIPKLQQAWAALVDGARERGSASTSIALDTRSIDLTATLRDIGAEPSRQIVFCIAIDVTHHRLAGESAHLRGENESQNRFESLGLVAGGIAHDFNNQLVSVLAEASAAREDTTLTETTRDALRRIEAAAKRMAQLTRQLLAYAGRGRIQSELLDPDELLEQAREQLTKLVRDGALEIKAASGSVVVEADRSLLRQVLTNLVANASEALPAGGGSVSIETRLVLKHDKAWWQLEVIDNGVGITAGDVTRIFDPFFTTKPGRHGLGLSAVHGIVRRLHGEIEVDSQLGTGARFRLRLPVIPNAQPKRKRSTSKQQPMPTLRGMRILIADDEPSVRATVRRLLERRGATVVSADDGIDAAARMAEGTYGLMLFDVTMPGKTGYDLLALARATHPTTPVMLMSGYTEAGSGEEEPDLFLEKPFTTKTLDAAIEDLLKSRQ